MIYRSNGKKVSPFLAIAFVLMVIVAVISFTFNQNKSVFAYNEIADQEEVEETLQNESTQQNLDTVGSIAHGRGLGRGINVLTATEYDAFTSNFVFDVAKLENMYANKTIHKKGVEYNGATYKLEELQLTDTLNGELSAKIDFTIINAGESSLSNTGLKLNKYRYKYYNSYRYDYKNYTLSLTNYNDADIFSDNFSEAFLRDLNEVKNGSMSEKRFFAIYGTHIVASAIYGGKISSIYTVASNKVKISAELVNDLSEYVDVFDSNTLENFNVVKK